MAEPRASLICWQCHFEIELDDVAIRGTTRTVCLRCFERQTGTEKRMPDAVRRDATRAAGQGDV